MAIVDAVYDLAATVGLVGISMGKVAKAASVSPATIYIYYKDKADLISRMYEGVKDLMDHGLAEAVNSVDDLDDKIRAAQRHFIAKFLRHPREALFLNSIHANDSLIDQRAREHVAERALPFKHLFDEMRADPNYRVMSEKVAATFISAPLVLVGSATPEELELAIELSISALKRR